MCHVIMIISELSETCFKVGKHFFFGFVTSNLLYIKTQFMCVVELFYSLAYGTSDIVYRLYPRECPSQEKCFTSDCCKRL